VTRLVVEGRRTAPGTSRPDATPRQPASQSLARCVHFWTSGGRASSAASNQSPEMSAVAINQRNVAVGVASEIMVHSDKTGASAWMVRHSALADVSGLPTSGSVCSPRLHRHTSSEGRDRTQTGVQRSDAHSRPAGRACGNRAGHRSTRDWMAALGGAMKRPGREARINGRRARSATSRSPASVCRLHFNLRCSAGCGWPACKRGGRMAARSGNGRGSASAEVSRRRRQPIMIWVSAPTIGLPPSRGSVRTARHLSGTRRSRKRRPAGMAAA
jgi:hypothetical protein